MLDLKKSFSKEAKKFNIDVSEQNWQALLIYKNMLCEWNDKFNLTAIKDEQGIFFRHFLDSLSLSFVFDLNNFKQLADLGSGAGLPGIVLKIFFPKLKICLIESTQKKANFLKELINKLELKDTIVIADRIEKVKLKFDLVVARALAKTALALKLALPLLKSNGIIALYKQIELSQEMQEAKNFILQNKLDVDKKIVDVFNGDEYIKRAIVLYKRKIQIKLL